MRVFGTIIVVLGLLVATVPSFNTCEQEGKLLTLANGRQVPMKCTWSARAEMAVGASLVLLGGLLAFSRRRAARRNLGIMGLALGAVTILVPTVLIGVCSDMTATCNLVLRPAMSLVGTLVIGASLASLVVAHGEPEPAL